MQKYSYTTSGTCSKQIDIECEGNIIRKVSFIGGCNGNLKGLGALVEGMDKETAISKLKGIKCGARLTSCPDQLSIALEKGME